VQGSGFGIQEKPPVASPLTDESYLCRQRAPRGLPSAVPWRSGFRLSQPIAESPATVLGNRHGRAHCGIRLHLNYRGNIYAWHWLVLRSLRRDKSRCPRKCVGGLAWALGRFWSGTKRARRSWCGDRLGTARWISIGHYSPSRPRGLEPSTN
jgi:hypothetical protein